MWALSLRLLGLVFSIFCTDHKNGAMYHIIPNLMVILWALVMGPFGFGGVSSMVYGIYWVCIGVQIRGPYGKDCRHQMAT